MCARRCDWLIEFENVSFSYTGQEHGGLRDINLKISDGEFVLFCGRSGCGKTTITRLVNGLIPQFYQGELHGRVLVDGQEISNIPMYQIAAKVGSVFQNPRTQFFNVDTDSEIAFGIENEARPPKKLAERVEQTTEDLHIQKLRNRNIFELSGGEKQKIAFASVYAMNPQIYLLDEPSSNLDMTSIQELKEHLRLIKKQGKTVLIAEHRLYYLMELADRIVYLENGEIKGIYTPEEFRQLSEPDREHMGLRAVDLQAVFPPKAHLPAPPPVLELRNVTLRYKKQTILHDIELSAGKGEVIGVVGHNGAGKTTFIKKMIDEAFKGEQIVLIENEFGEVGIDGGFLKDAGIQITEMNSGCICCSLVGDFGQALEQVLTQFHPDRILIEPSGVGKLSDVIGAVQRLNNHDIQLNAFVTVADATKCKIYMKNFGEFFNNQIEHAAAIVLSRTDGMSEKKLMDTVALLREHNANAPIITTPWDQLDGKLILETMENKDTLKEELARLAAEQAAHDEEHEHLHHDHHHHDHDEDHDHDGHEHEHEHHHHDHNEHEHEHHHDHEHDEHEHHHHHDGSCSCGHDHDADDVFISWGTETPRKYTEEEIHAALSGLDNAEQCGIVLRAKGIVPCTDGTWIHFDYVPGEQNVRRGPASFTGRLCVIGSELKEHELEHLFCLH